MWDEETFKPVLTTTSEQQPPIYKDWPEIISNVFYSLNFTSIYDHLWTMTPFWGPKDGHCTHVWLQLKNLINYCVPEPVHINRPLLALHADLRSFLFCSHKMLTAFASTHSSHCHFTKLNIQYSWLLTVKIFKVKTSILTVFICGI